MARAGARSRPARPGTRPWLLAQHDDAYLDIAGGRYDWMAGWCARRWCARARGVSLTDRIDRVATHPFWGLVVLMAAAGGWFR